MAHPVKLYIYDLSGGLAKRFAPMFGIDFDIEGIWHTSVVVHGMEVFLGSDGIQFSQPGGTSLGCPLLQHDMGSTNMTATEFQDLIGKLSQEDFSADKYDLFLYNCNTFSNQVSLRLTNCQIPQHILDLPLKVLNSPIVQMLRPVIQKSTPRGTKMADKDTEESEHLFEQLREADKASDRQSLTEENLSKIVSYLDGATKPQS